MVSSMFESVAYEKSVNIKYDIQEDIKVNVDKEDIKQITSILLDNAIKHTESGNNVYVELKKEKGLNDNYTINTNLNEIQNATESIDNVKTFATTFLIITLIISAIVLFVINMINIRERKYEIGVYRTIGISKLKLTEQFVLELLIVTIISLSIGAILGGMLSKPVGNKLLENEISESKSSQEQVQENFGKPGGMVNDHKMGGMKEVQAFDSIDAVVDIKVIAELLGIGIVLTLVSSLASMISIQKFSPLTILKERS